MENTAPTFLEGKMLKSILEDESSYLQFGQEVEYEFYTYELPAPKPSSWIDYPTLEEPLNLFKFGSVEINMGQDLRTWNR